MIGAELKSARKANGLTQAQLAEACGVSEATINATERGRTAPQVSTLELILDAIGYRLEVVPK